MEYEIEDSDFRGNVPEFGAIFMANIETKKACFKKKVFGLQSSLANFVKQVKAGMVLFLFEYENRQLFGVYRATSDGAINVMPHAFSSLGKQFPAQVCFAPIWICSPLSESEFKGAISENYFSRKKFKFGLSEDQVRRLLQLFSARKLKSLLPLRQLSEDFHRSSNKVRRRVRGDMFSTNERLEMEYGLEDFSSSANHSFIDDVVGNKGEEGIFGLDFTANYADDSLIKHRRVSCERAETDLYRSCDRVLESATNCLDVHMDSERMPDTSVSFLRGENADSDCNVFSSGVGPNFTREPLDLRKRAEWPRPATAEGRSLMDDMLQSELYFDPFHADHGYNVNLDDISYEGNLLRERGTNRSDKVLMSERVLGLSHNNNYVRLGSFSEKLGTPLDGKLKRVDEQRLSSVDNLMKANYIDCRNRSTTLNVPSVHDRGVEGQVVDDYMLNKRTSVVSEPDIGNVTRDGFSAIYNVSGQWNRSSSECLKRPFLDAQIPDSNKNYQTSVTAYHDDVRRTFPNLSSVHHRRPLPAVVGQSSGLLRNTNPNLSESNYQALSRSKTFEADISSRLHISDAGNKVPGYLYSDYRDCPTTEISDSISLRSASAAGYQGLQFSPIALGAASFNDGFPINIHPYGASLGVGKYLSSQMPEELVTSCELQSPRGNLTDHDLQCQEYDPVNYELEWYNDAYGLHLKNDTDSGKQRKSVFTRLTSTLRTRVHHNLEKDTDTDIESSVDEVMDILRQSQKSRLKKLKRIKMAVQQLVEGEMKKNIAMNSFDNCTGNSDLKLIPENINEVSSKAIDEGVNETLRETRAVEFRRRREKNRSMVDKTECGDLKEESDKSGENAEPAFQLDKQPKRRKLVRPVFGVTDVGGSDVNKNSLPLKPLTKRTQWVL